MMIKKGYNGLQILPLIFTSVDEKCDRSRNKELYYQPSAGLNLQTFAFKFIHFKLDLRWR